MLSDSHYFFTSLINTPEKVIKGGRKIPRNYLNRWHHGGCFPICVWSTSLDVCVRYTFISHYVPSYNKIRKLLSIVASEVERPVHQLDDIRRKVVTVAPDGSIPISGLYTRVTPKMKWPGGILYWSYNETNNFSEYNFAQLLANLLSRSQKRKEE
jgi:hypothetical protein